MENVHDKVEEIDNPFFEQVSDEREKADWEFLADEWSAMEDAMIEDLNTLNGWSR